MIAKTRVRSVLMICMGNICRSPTAEAVLRHKLGAAGLGEAVNVDSAGTHAWHTGDAPDERSQRHAARRGYDLSALRARRVNDDDFERFDLLLVMDHENLHHLRDACPPQHHPKLRRLMEFAGDKPLPIVPDPYYGDEPEFEQVLDLVEMACDGLIESLRQQAAPT